MSSAIICLSGGMDSATLLYKLLSDGWTVRALAVDYGQRHSKELHAAAKIASLAGVEYRCLNLDPLRAIMGGSSQTDASVKVPHGHYAEESMKLTVVPNRNMILLALATAWAVSTKSEVVAYAAHAGDHTIYPDCRPEFTAAMEQAMALCDWHQVKLLHPFIKMTKGEIAKLGLALGVPFEHTWTCYEGGERPCGKCGSCNERREAFDLTGATDPLMEV